MQAICLSEKNFRFSLNSNISAETHHCERVPKLSVIREKFHVTDLVLRECLFNVSDAEH